jgi:hypothetical protein
MILRRQFFSMCVYLPPSPSSSPTAPSPIAPYRPLLLLLSFSSFYKQALHSLSHSSRLKEVYRGVERGWKSNFFICSTERMKEGLKEAKQK